MALLAVESPSEERVVFKAQYCAWLFEHRIGVVERPQFLIQLERLLFELLEIVNAVDEIIVEPDFPIDFSAVARFERRALPL